MPTGTYAPTPRPRHSAIQVSRPRYARTGKQAKAHTKPQKRRTTEKRRSAQTAQTAETARAGAQHGANCRTARTAKRREVPYGANCPTARGAKRRQRRRHRTARTAERREGPKSATADGGSRRARTRTGHRVAPLRGCALRQFAPSGSSRPLMSAPLSSFGTSRRRAVRAPGQFALLGSSRCWAVRAFSRTRARRFSVLRRWAVRAFSRTARAVSAFCAVCALRP